MLWYLIIEKGRVIGRSRSFALEEKAARRPAATERRGASPKEFNVYSGRYESVTILSN